MRIRTPILVGSLWLAGAALDRAWACATCFGASDSKLAQGMNMGILVLLGVVGMVLGGLTLGFVALAARARHVNGRTAGTRAPDTETGAGTGAPGVPN